MLCRIVTGILVTGCLIANVDSQPLLDASHISALTENAQKFIELYGLATQLMNLGGSILNNAQEGSYGNRGSSSSGNSGLSSNGIFGEVIKPQLKAVNNYDFPKSSYSLSEYGGGPLGSGTGNFQSAKQSGLEMLLNQFLGSSVSTSPKPSSNSLPNLANFFSPSYHPENPSSRTNIDNIVNALVRSGAKQVTPDGPGNQNLLAQFFG
uniref:DUF148 domain-containing protein n=1 Tax=Syphacia muris TaxID=451379 RepID=A0A0N5AFW9_9BILA